MSILPPLKSHDVTMIWEAPESIHLAAFVALMPPPICNPSGQVFSASNAASSFPLPSFITWPPFRLSIRYFSANQEGGFSEMKLVRSEFVWLSLIELPTICFTLPLCRSMHGLNMSSSYVLTKLGSSFG